MSERKATTRSGAATPKSKAAKDATRKPTRRRRTAEEARRVILDAAQRRLTEEGPEAIRLQEIAKDVQLSHPAILHHFESREGLMRALAERAMGDLNRDLIRVIEGPESAEPGDMLDRIFETVGDAGHARLLAWRCLSGRAARQRDGRRQLKELTDVVHRRICEGATRTDTAPPPWEETAFCIRLATLALFGDAIIGEVVDASTGLDPDAQARFRRWLGNLLTDQLVSREEED